MSSFDQSGDQLKRAHAIRHVGIECEKAGRLEEAEKHYDEARALYREHSTEDDLNYANAVRYPAAIKNRLGKSAESEALWREAMDRYEKVGIADGIVEGKLHLANFAIDRGDLTTARSWFEQANIAAAGSESRESHDFIAKVKTRLKDAENAGKEGR